MNRLEDKLNEYKDSGVTPMHMPGHKRNPGLVPSYLESDITEIAGFDNLHSPSGILRDIENVAASIWNAKSSILSVNGATAPILASIMAASANGKILIASNCHISVWHALELTEEKFAVINPVTDPMYPFCLHMDPSEIGKALDEDSSIKTVVITSPTYEGVVSDVKAIADEVHARGAALIVDESHGSHFGLNDFFPSTSITDVVIKSIHKTLHAPTQTAVLLTYSDLIREDLIRHYMDVFESSSPSYILMSGISKVVYDLKENPALTAPWVDALKEARQKLNAELLHVKLFDVEGNDKSKLVILTGNAVNGYKLADVLREHKIEVEAAFDTHVIAMTGIGDNVKSLSCFAEELIKIDRDLEGSADASYENVLPTDPVMLSMNIKDAVRSQSVKVSREDSIGKVSSSYVFKYPPGIPVLIPGMKVTEDRLKLVSDEFLSVVSG